ncbi:MAG: pentapeptide repeat-containing protein [bacterium]
MFSDANLKNAQFREAVISKSCFDRANLQNADFYRVIAKECSFIKVKFNQA